MEERGDLKYMTDIMPAAHETFAAKFVGRYFSTPKKMGAQMLKLTSMPVLPLHNRLLVS